MDNRRPGEGWGASTESDVSKGRGALPHLRKHDAELLRLYLVQFVALIEQSNVCCQSAQHDSNVNVVYYDQVCHRLICMSHTLLSRLVVVSLTGHAMAACMGSEGAALGEDDSIAGASF